MASALGATCRPVRCSKPVVQTPNCVLRGSWSAPSAPIRRGEPQACCCQGADEPRKTDARVQTVRTYNEAQDRLYRAQKVQEEDDDGSIATLVPGGLKSQRSRRGGAAAAEARRERSKPLKINTDLKLYRARRKRMNTSCTPAGSHKDRMNKETEQDLRAVLARDPTDERTYVILGTLLLRQKRVDEAREVYEEGCTVAQGSNAFIWTAMGNLERKEGNIKKARQCFEAALVACETHAAAYHGWGQLELSVRRFDAARQVLLKGIKMTKAKPNPHLYAALANLAIRTGLIGEARYWLREGTNTPLGSQSNALWCTWGNLEWKEMQDTQAALYCFNMALSVYPRSRYALLSLGLMEKANGNIDRARELLKRGARYNPTDAALRQAYGVMLLEERKFKAARNQFKAGARADPSHLPVWQAWAVMEGSLGNHEDARTLFQRGVWSAPKSPDLVYLWQAWGVMEARLGNLVAARSLFKTAVSLEPRNDACWEAWLRMEEENDLLERANGLRLARYEAIESNQVPSSFSTMPDTPGPVLSTVKQWMSQFIRTDSAKGPAVVYTPPPGRTTARMHAPHSPNPHPLDPSRTPYPQLQAQQQQQQQEKQHQKHQSPSQTPSSSLNSPTQPSGSNTAPPSTQSTPSSQAAFQQESEASSAAFAAQNVPPTQAPQATTPPPPATETPVATPTISNGGIPGSDNPMNPSNSSRSKGTTASGNGRSWGRPSDRTSLTNSLDKSPDSSSSSSSSSISEAAPPKRRSFTSNSYRFETKSSSPDGQDMPSAPRPARAQQTQQISTSTSTGVTPRQSPSTSLAYTASGNSSSPTAEQRGRSSSVDSGVPSAVVQDTKTEDRADKDSSRAVSPERKGLSGELEGIEIAEPVVVSRGS